MLITEDYGTDYVRHYSDAGFYIIQEDTGILYEDAIDKKNTLHTYAETTEKIPDEEEATEEDYLKALEELGVTE